MKRSPMRRKARRRKTTAEGRAYMLAVKLLPCCAPPSEFECRGDVEAHHAGRRPGVGMKCSDLETIPLCWFHHCCWHNASGPFSGWTKPQRLDWADARIAETQALIAGRVDTATGEAL